MVERFAVVIALEEYADSAIGQIKFAGNDGLGMAEALKMHGIPDGNVAVLLNARATKTSIESKIRTTCKKLSPNSELYLFYAGHGLVDQGQNFLTCYDSDPQDLLDTSIPLASLMRQVQGSSVKGVFLFLDSAHLGFPLHLDMPQTRAGMDGDELEAFSKKSPSTRIFTACKPEEHSYSSTQLQHGIWTHYLIEAIAGRGKDSLTKRNHLTTGSLQKFLASNIPLKARTLHLGRALQTPCLWEMPGEDAVLFDLSEHLAQAPYAGNSGAVVLKQAYFASTTSGSLKRLPGWKSSYSLPRDTGPSTRQFVKKVGSASVQETFDIYFAKIKTAFSFKRNDCVVQAEEDSVISCITPLFTFSVELACDASVPSNYIQTISLSEIQDESVLFTEEFARLFDNEFQDVVLEPKSVLNIEHIIDVIEDISGGDITVSYPADASKCTVRIGDGPMEIVFSAREIRFVFPQKESIQVLTQSILQSVNLLNSESDLALLT
jgi:hypothetical protein